MIGLGRVLFKRRGRLLFVNKKKQKNFFKLGRAGFVATGPSEQTFFAPLFEKARAKTFSRLACFRGASTGPLSARCNSQSQIA
jgi:hypothetical protein